MATTAKRVAQSAGARCRTSARTGGNSAACKCEAHPSWLRAESSSRVRLLSWQLGERSAEGPLNGSRCWGKLALASFVLVTNLLHGGDEVDSGSDSPGYLRPPRVRYFRNPFAETGGSTSGGKVFDVDKILMFSLLSRANPDVRPTTSLPSTRTMGRNQFLLKILVLRGF